MGGESSHNEHQPMDYGFSSATTEPWLESTKAERDAWDARSEKVREFVKEFLAAHKVSSPYQLSLPLFRELEDGMVKVRYAPATQATPDAKQGE
jgi:hypothetical protein